MRKRKDLSQSKDPAATKGNSPVSPELVSAAVEVAASLKAIEKIMLDRPPKSRRRENAELGIAILTLFAGLVGGCFAFWQIREAIRALEVSNRNNNLGSWNTVMASGQEVNKAFIDNPQLQKYFFDGEPALPRNHPDYEKLAAHTNLVLDYMDGVIVMLHYTKDSMIAGSDPAPFIDRQAWETYLRSLFARSPTLCRAVNEDLSLYGAYTRQLAAEGCGGALK